MKHDRRAMPSYAYEPPPLREGQGVGLTTAVVVWAFLAVLFAVEVYLAVSFIADTRS